MHSPSKPLKMYSTDTQIHFNFPCIHPSYNTPSTPLHHSWWTSFSSVPNTHPSTLYCTNISIHNRQQLTHPSNYKALTPNKPLNTLHCTHTNIVPWFRIPTVLPCKCHWMPSNAANAVLIHIQWAWSMFTSSWLNGTGRNVSNWSQIV